MKEHDEHKCYYAKLVHWELAEIDKRLEDIEGKRRGRMGKYETIIQLVKLVGGVAIFTTLYFIYAILCDIKALII